MSSDLIKAQLEKYQARTKEITLVLNDLVGFPKSADGYVDAAVKANALQLRSIAIAQRDEAGSSVVAARMTASKRGRPTGSKAKKGPPSRSSLRVAAKGGKEGKGGKVDTQKKRGREAAEDLDDGEVEEAGGGKQEKQQKTGNEPDEDAMAEPPKDEMAELLARGGTGADAKQLAQQLADEKEKVAALDRKRRELDGQLKLYVHLSLSNSE